MSRNIVIEPFSCCPLLLRMRANSREIGTGTGFVVERGGKQFLVSNWHVLAGRHPETKQPLSPTGAIPDEVVVTHHSANLGTWLPTHYGLLDRDSGEPVWAEHPRGSEVDLAALEIDIMPALKTYPLDLGLADHDVRLHPAMTVSIVGFPFGLAAEGAFPIWKTGHIASDPDLNYNGLPAFLIDATTREGMSGSPVMFFSSSGYPATNAAFKLGAGVLAFLGVYSGRIREGIEVGRVWRPHLVGEMLDAAL